MSPNAGWAVLDLGMMQAEYLRTGAVSAPMALVVAFHLLYVTDALYFEPAILTTMDITSDGFGFMLVCGVLSCELSSIVNDSALQGQHLTDRRFQDCDGGHQGKNAVRQHG